MSWTFTTSGAASIKAGANCSTVIKANSDVLDTLSDEAEGRIEVETKTAWRDNYSGLASGAKYLLGDVESSLIAMRMINYDMSGYTSRQEAGTMLDVNDDIVNKGMAALKEPSSNKLKTP